MRRRPRRAPPAVDPTICTHEAPWRATYKSSNGEWLYGICWLCGRHVSKRIEPEPEGGN